MVLRECVHGEGGVREGSVVRETEMSHLTSAAFCPWLLIPLPLLKGFTLGLCTTTDVGNGNTVSGGFGSPKQLLGFCEGGNNRFRHSASLCSSCILMRSLPRKCHAVCVRDN